MEKLLSPEEVGELLGMTPAALAQMRYTGTGPRYRRLNAKTIRYANADLEAWLETTARLRTDESAAVA